MKTRNKNYILFSLFFFLFLLGGISLAHALSLEINYPRVPGADAPQDFLNSSLPKEEILSSFIKYIFALMVWASGVIALVVLITAGIRYLTSAGKADQMATAKEQFFAVFFGLLILFTSILFLKIINPQFTDITLPTIATPSPTVSLSPLPTPPVYEVRSTINAEIPFGTIIEKGIFESVVPEAERNKRKSRMERIRDIAVIVQALSQKLKEQSEELKKLTEQCTCNNSDPNKEPKPCCWLDSPGEGCIDNECRNKPGCTCDPCYEVRAKIKELQQKNLEVLSLGTTITITDENNNQRNIKTSLAQELTNANEEIRLIKEEIGKLERAEKFMIECQLWPMDSMAVSLFNKDYFESNKWPFVVINFWGKIIAGQDWATFYCPVSGSIWGEEKGELPTEEMMVFPEYDETAKMGQTHCTEVAVGEMIDRSKRLGYKFVERLEKLINLGEQMHNAVDQLHVFISQCSSQRCYSYCNCEPCDEIACCYCVKRCGDNPQYPDGACPKTQINDQLQKIIEIFDGKGQQNSSNYQEGIKGVVSGPKQNTGSAQNNDQKEKIGIITIIDQIIPFLLEDLDKIIRLEMKMCVTDVPPEKILEDPDQPQLILSDCERALRSLGEENLIQKCCLDETAYQSCLYGCYLETNMNQTDLQARTPAFQVALNGKYKTCLKDCLKTNSGEIAKCSHKINFYCCGK